MVSTVRPTHTPVLLAEACDLLEPAPGKRFLDGTLGLGGHAQELLKRAGGKIEILGLDRDPSALESAEGRLAAFGGSVSLENLPYSRFEHALEKAGWDALDGALLDLGVSSLQLDDHSRGFSFTRNGPLDMRMDQDPDRPSAKDLVMEASMEELKRIIRDLGEDPQAGRIAKAIVRHREKDVIETTFDLAEIVRRAYPAAWRRKARNDPATRTFMALRMAVNDELGELDTFLGRIVDYLAPGGRVAIISFHSMEDRAVKHSFRAEAKGCVCPPRQPLCTCGRKPRLKILTKKPMRPSEEEIAANPRSRSAKLRGAERLGGEA